MLGVAAVPVPMSAVLTTRVAVGVPDAPRVATMMTLSPTAKLPEVSAAFFVPNWVPLVTSTVTVWPLRVRMVQLSPLIDWMVARKAIRPAAFARPAAGAGVAVFMGSGAATELDDISDAVTAVPTPHAVSPETSTTAITPAVTPVAIG